MLYKFLPAPSPSSSKHIYFSILHDFIFEWWHSKFDIIRLFPLTWKVNGDSVCILKYNLSHSHYQAAGWEQQQTMLWASTIHAPNPSNLLYMCCMHWRCCDCLHLTFNRACFPEIWVHRKRRWGFWVSSSSPMHSVWFLSYFSICLNLQTSMGGLNVSRVYLYNQGLNYLRDRLSLPHLSMAARQVCFVFPPRKNKSK